MVLVAGAAGFVAVARLHRAVAGHPLQGGQRFVERIHDRLPQRAGLATVGGGSPGCGGSGGGKRGSDAKRGRRMSRHRIDANPAPILYSAKNNRSCSCLRNMAWSVPDRRWQRRSGAQVTHRTPPWCGVSFGRGRTTGGVARPVFSGRVRRSKRHAREPWPQRWPVGREQQGRGRSTALMPAPPRCQ